MAREYFESGGIGSSVDWREELKTLRKLQFSGLTEAQSERIKALMDREESEKRGKKEPLTDAEKEELHMLERWQTEGKSDDGVPWDRNVQHVRLRALLERK